MSENSGNGNCYVLTKADGSKWKVYAVADKVPAEQNIITVGKEYELTDLDDYGGRIILDDGDEVDFSWKDSAFLHGGNWRRVERPLADATSPSPTPVAPSTPAIDDRDNQIADLKKRIDDMADEAQRAVLLLSERDRYVAELEARLANRKTEFLRKAALSHGMSVEVMREAAWRYDEIEKLFGGAQ